MPVDLKTMLEQIKAAIEQFKAEGFSIASIRKLLSSIVKLVEQLDSPDFKGEAKKKAALDLLDQAYVMSGIDVPWVPQSLERLILRCIAGMIIDALVAQFNREKSW